MTTIAVPAHEDVTQLDSPARHQFLSLIPDIEVLVSIPFDLVYGITAHFEAMTGEGRARTDDLVVR